MYLAFRLVFDFILPVVRTTRRIRKGFREMHERMNSPTEQYNSQSENYTRKNSDNSNANSGDYIDFEEIKD